MDEKWGTPIYGNPQVGKKQRVFMLSKHHEVYKPIWNYLDS